MLVSVPTLPLSIVEAGYELRGMAFNGLGVRGGRIAIHADRVRIVDCVFLNCPVNCIQLWGTASDVVIEGCVFDGCQAFNTRDDWTGRRVIFRDCIVRNVPAGAQGLLIDQPATAEVGYSGVSILDCEFSASPGAKRCVGLARCVGVRVSDCWFWGAEGVEDLVHFEDLASMVSIEGCQFFANGAKACIDGSLGQPDAGFKHKDHDSREVLVSGCQMRCDGGIGVYVQGKRPHVIQRLTVEGNQIFDAKVGVEAKAGACYVGPGQFFNCTTNVRLLK